MKYRSGTVGRVFVARFQDHDDILEGLVQIAKNENIRAAYLQIVGGMREGSIVVGPEKDEIPPKPLWRQLGESNEVLGFGTIFWQEDTPRVHLHGAFGRRDTVKVGCVREKSETFLVLEAIITEIAGIEAVRELDPVSNMVLLKM